MNAVSQKEDLNPDIASILSAMSVLMEDLHDADLQLQEALSTLAVRAKSIPEFGSLQHIDLLTQTHRDLAKLLSTLSGCLAGEPVERETLKSRLTLRSLQDALFQDETDSDDAEVAAGEMSLF